VGGNGDFNIVAAVVHRKTIGEEVAVRITVLSIVPAWTNVQSVHQCLKKIARIYTTHTHKHAHIHTYVHTFIHTPIDSDTCTDAHACICCVCVFFFKSLLCESPLQNNRFYRFHTTSVDRPNKHTHARTHTYTHTLPHCTRTQ
jgi:hypothetical protein